MSDTEPEAHRLLATATADLPPGMDLLDGFVQARRDRARRTRRGTIAAAGIAVAAAVIAVAVTAGSAPPALATVTSALTRTLAQSYHLTEIDSSHYIQDNRITNRSHGKCASEADPVRHLEAVSCSNGVATREVGRYTYLYSARPAGHPGKHWERVPTSSLNSPVPINWFTAATPPQMLAQIKKASKVTAIGPVSGPGWTGTRYAFSSSPVRRISLTGTVDVDRHGRARVLVLTLRATGAAKVYVATQALSFSDFGEPVTVTPPPADQIDMTWP